MESGLLMGENRRWRYLGRSDSFQWVVRQAHHERPDLACGLRVREIVDAMMFPGEARPHPPAHHERNQQR